MIFVRSWGTFPPNPPVAPPLAKMVWPCKQNISGKAFQISFTCESKGKRPVRRPRTRWADYIESIGWNRLGLQPSEMLAVVADRDVWRLNLELQSSQPSRPWAGSERRRRRSFKSQNLAIIDPTTSLYCILGFWGAIRLIVQYCMAYIISFLFGYCQ